MAVLNIKLNALASVKSLVLHFDNEPPLGHSLDSSWSARNLALQTLQSTNGSEKVSS